VPCGVADTRFGVTSLTDLGHLVSMPEVDMALRREFEGLFGATEVTGPHRAGAASAAQARVRHD
jgi:lipoyl(octanoyl) transferase